MHEPPQVVPGQSDLCTQLRAEFWDRFATACAQQAWALHGTTSQRLLARGIFIELKDEHVQIESLGGSLAPYVPAVIDALRPEVTRLVPPTFRGDQWLALLAAVYARTPGDLERPIEEIYRNAVILSQKEAFWKSPDAKSLVRLTRPMFRARLSEVLNSNGGESPAVQLGTTIDVRRSWEIFSPRRGASRAGGPPCNLLRGTAMPMESLTASQLGRSELRQLADNILALPATS